MFEWMKQTVDEVSGIIQILTHMAYPLSVNIAQDFKYVLYKKVK